MNNKILIHKIDGSIVHVNELPGITVDFRGANSQIEFYEPLPKITNCRFVLASECSIIVQRTRHYIDELIVYQKGNNSKLYIGENFSCYTTVIFYDEPDKTVHIGDGCMFAKNTTIRTSDAHSIIDISSGKVVNYGKSVTIGNNVWIASSCMLLKGVVIPDNCVIGANSCVSRGFDSPNSLIVGNPAEVKRTNIFWDRAAPDKYNVYPNENETVTITENNGSVKFDISTILLDIGELNIEKTNTLWNSKIIFDDFESYSMYHLHIGKISQVSGQKINYCQLVIKDIVRNTGIYCTNVILDREYDFIIHTKDIINPLELKIYAGIAGNTAGIALKVKKIKLERN